MPAAPKAAKQKKNVTKSRAHPARSIDNPEDDHPIGLWINTEFFRKLTRHDIGFPMRDGALQDSNRYNTPLYHAVI